MIFQAKDFYEALVASHSCAVGLEIDLYRSVDYSEDEAI